VSTLLHAAYGVTGSVTIPGSEEEQLFRASPSGGALYPLELYVVAREVDGLASGVYHYDAHDHVLEQLGTAAPPADELSPYADLVGAAQAMVFVAAVFWRSRFKYGLRGYRFVLLEAGHVVQNLLLAATALGLASFPLGGFFDDAVDRALELDGVDVSTVYAACVGAPR
jgi:SagB-type dehydrogenase family enzyme